MRRRLRALVLALPLFAAHASVPGNTEFAGLVERLSEGGGFFQSDNLVSNETSYLHPLGRFRALGLKGGAYLGVGPEQGFSYIAEIEPEIAFVIDIRRDNLLLHLLLKAMFETARNRLEYLCLLYGRAPPEDLPLWTDLDLESILDYIDRTPLASARHDRTHRELMVRVEAYGIPLSNEDQTTLRRFHDEFVAAGLDLRYSSRGRAARLHYPTVRQLYLETDLEGNPGSYLATEDRWRVVRALQRADRVIPVVGDLAGPKAVRAIATYLRETRRTVSVYYLSNVESYLFRYGSFPAFVENVRQLPVTPTSVLVRSWFGRGMAIPGSVPGHFSTQLVQPVSRFLELTLEPERVNYWAVVTDGESVPIPRLFERPPR